MIDYTLLCYGLTQTQVHTLKCRFPYGYDFCVIPEGELDDFDILQRVVRNTWCMFINPKKLKPGQLSEIITAHKLDVSQILCKHRRAVKNRAKLFLGVTVYPPSLKFYIGKSFCVCQGQRLESRYSFFP